MPTYSNGEIPESMLVTFKTGRNSTDGEWKHQLPPSSYRKHEALVGVAFKRTERTLEISEGWGAYRTLAAQKIARLLYGYGAAVPGTSSHGGIWEGKQTAAMDYSNWAWVYANHGGREAFYADCRAVGLAPGLIHPSRGNNYPDEPWHVIDLDPWASVPAGETVEDDMPLNATTDYDAFKNMMWRFLKYDSRPGGAAMDAKLGLTIFQQLEGIPDRTAEKVWDSDVIMLDANGLPEKNPDGTYKTYKAWGVVSSTAAQAVEANKGKAE